MLLFLPNQHFMQTIQTITSITTAIAAIVGATTAALGLTAWKKQLKGKTDYELARRYLRAVYKIRDAIKFVRNPFIPIEEINAALKERGNDESPANHNESTRAVYSLRWKKVVEAGSDLDIELREAEISWGRGAVDIEKDFEGCINTLFVSLKMFAEFEDVPPERDIIYDSGEEDEYNKKLKAAMLKIENYLTPHLR